MIKVGDKVFEYKSLSQVEVVRIEKDARNKIVCFDEKGETYYLWTLFESEKLAKIQQIKNKIYILELIVNEAKEYARKNSIDIQDKSLVFKDYKANINDTFYVLEDISWNYEEPPTRAFNDGIRKFSVGAVNKTHIGANGLYLCFSHGEYFKTIQSAYYHCLEQIEKNKIELGNLELEGSIKTDANNSFTSKIFSKVKSIFSI